MSIIARGKSGMLEWGGYGGLVQSLAFCTVCRECLSLYNSECCCPPAAAPAWGCEARLELDAAGSVNRLKASRVGALPNPRNPSGCLQEQFLTTRLLLGIPISIPK